MYHDLTKGNISRSLLLFALPMMAGNLLQQFYNIADTLIVGRVLGRDALAAVGSAYTLMTFLTSIFLGLSLGSGALFSIYKGRGDEKTLKSSVFHAFVLIMAVTVVLNILVYLGLDGILCFRCLCFLNCFRFYPRLSLRLYRRRNILFRFQA